MDVKTRLEALRGLMAAQGLAAYYVPSTDPHQSEYVAATWQRRAFISGFNGSAGTVVVTADKAGLWTDSRYFLQAAQQLEGSGVDLFKMGEPNVPDIETWLPAVLKRGDSVGFDPEVVSMGTCQALTAALGGAGISLLPVDSDLVEAVWGAGVPAMPCTDVNAHAVEYAGMASDAKIRKVRAALTDASANAAVFSALDEIAWLFNLRGSDVDYNPVFIAYALVTLDKSVLFTDRRRLATAAVEKLPPEVEVRGYAALGDALRDLGGAGAKVWLDPATTNQKIASVVTAAGATILPKPGVIPAWKAVKNPAEMGGMVNSHLRDGVAMARFLYWLSRAAARGKQTEISVGDKLREFRAESPLFVGMSFSTIAGYGPHGAIVHYSASRESNAVVKPGNLLLLDSGAQYLDGTTDITRTVTIGDATAEQKMAYTAVLKGHLALRRSIFLHGANGYQLDMLARSRLWEHGLNYGHGTGHGLGAYLSVHEGPFSVSLRRNMTPLEVGHVLSNEPGFYKTDAWGVRIENIVTVVEKLKNDNGTFLGFEDLTLCPYDRNLIAVGLLDPVERAQVDAYHKLVFDTLAPRLDERTSIWLKRATRPLPKR